MKRTSGTDMICRPLRMVIIAMIQDDILWSPPSGLKTSFLIQRIYGYTSPRKLVRSLIKGIIHNSVILYWGVCKISSHSWA